MYTSPVNQSAGPFAVSMLERVICMRGPIRRWGWSPAPRRTTEPSLRDPDRDRAVVVEQLGCLTGVLAGLAALGERERDAPGRGALRLLLAEADARHGGSRDRLAGIGHGER